MPEPVSDMNRNQEVGFLPDYYHHQQHHSAEEPLDINVRNLENLTLMDNFSAVTSLTTTMENNENLSYFQDNFDPSTVPCGAPSFLDDPKEGNISRTVRVPSSEHVAEIVGRQGCKIKDLRARTNTYIKTPMRTQSPVFVVTGKEEAVLHVMDEINNAAEHFTHIRASRNQHKAGGGGLESAKPMSREGDIVIYVTVPYRVVGLVVGLKGQTIKAIQQDTDTFIVTPNRDKEPTFEIRGQPDNVKRAEMMIQRHIETRTRHCRLQDTTNLPTNWNEEQRYSGSSSGDFHFYHSDLSTHDNGHSSGSVTSVTSNYNGNSGSLINGQQPQPQNQQQQQQQQQQQMGSSSGFNSGIPTIPTNGSYHRGWRGFNSLMEQHPSQTSGPMTTWSNGSGSDYLNGLANSGSPVLSSGVSPTSSGNRGNGSSSTIPYHMSVGNVSPPSNSSSSVSTPNDFLNEASSPANSQLTSSYGSQSMNSCAPFMRKISESSIESNPFSTLPFFTSAPTTSTKGSLVLGKLFQQNSGNSANLNNANMNNASSLGMSNLMNSSTTNSLINGSTLGLTGLSGDEVHPALSSTGGHPSPLASLRRPGMPAGSDMSVFTSQLSCGGPDLSSVRYPSGESSPTSKSCSLSEASGGSHGSPAPKLCRVCEEAEVVAALVPCGHNLFCMECAEAIINKPCEEDRVCPACKDTATDALHIRA